VEFNIKMVNELLTKTSTCFRDFDRNPTSEAMKAAIQNIWAPEWADWTNKYLLWSVSATAKLKKTNGSKGTTNTALAGNKRTNSSGQQGTTTSSHQQQPVKKARSGTATITSTQTNPGTTSRICVNYLAQTCSIGNGKACGNGSACKFEHADLARVKTMNKPDIEAQIKAALGQRNPTLMNQLLAVI
jgi:hypothetical protein